MPADESVHIVDEFHATKVHYIKVVPTFIEATQDDVYQLRHYSHKATVMRNSPPQVKFSYEFAPIQVNIRENERRWYDFFTSMVGVFGGTFAVMSILFLLFFNVQQKVSDAIQNADGLELTLMGQNAGNWQVGKQASPPTIPSTFYQ